MKISELNEQLEQEERFFREWNDWSVVEPRIAAALDQVLTDDSALLEDGAGERSVAHRLPIYLGRQFSGWHVDCEFNRQGEADDRVTKRVSATSPILSESRRGQATADVTPDIIIHKRPQQPEPSRKRGQNFRQR
jgi:hypothetical protein